MVTKLLQDPFAEELFSSGLFTKMSVAGAHGWSRDFEAIVLGVDRMVVKEALAQGAEERFFPPVVPRELLRRTGYMEKFPHLCGSIHSFAGDERAHERLLGAVADGKPWAPFLEETDVTLCPAACYPFYPSVAGRLPQAGAHVCLSSYVFRREPSQDPARRQIFRMREAVRVGTREQIQSWRARWMECGIDILRSLGLDVRIEAANDPFFGRARRFLAHTQRGQEAKFEILVPIADPERPTAVMSFNYHQESFASCFGIELHDGSLAESGCMGVGLERAALALLKRHGTSPARWPATVKNRLF